jgi:hypothetical protein
MEQLGEFFDHLAEPIKYLSKPSAFVPLKKRGKAKWVRGLKMNL